MSSLSFNNRQVQQWLNAYYFQYLFCSFDYCYNIIHLHIPFWAEHWHRKNKIEKKELMSWQHATIWALIAGNAMFEKILVDCFEWHMSTNITQAHAPSQSLRSSNQWSSHWQCQSNAKTMRLISFRLNVERARSLTCLLLCYYYNRSDFIGGISACMQNDSKSVWAA